MRTIPPVDDQHDLVEEPGAVARLAEVFAIVRGNWRDLVLFVAAFGVLSVFYLIITPATYTATMVLEVVANQASSTSASLQALSALTSGGAGLNPDQQRFNTMIDLIQSDAVAARVFKDKELVRRIFIKEWDDQSKSWRPPHGLLSFLARIPAELFGRPAWSPPSVRRLGGYLRDQIVVSNFGTNGLEQLSYRSPDPIFAVRVLKGVYSAADEEIKASDLRRTVKYIDYLDNRLKTVTMTQNRDALTQLLSDQERNRMLLEADLPYAATVVSPAQATDLPDQPKVVQIVVLFLAVGFFIGVLWSFFVRESILWNIMASKIAVVRRMWAARQKLASR